MKMRYTGGVVALRARLVKIIVCVALKASMFKIGPMPHLHTLIISACPLPWISMLLSVTISEMDWITAYDHYRHHTVQLW